MRVFEILSEQNDFEHSNTMENPWIAWENASAGKVPWRDVEPTLMKSPKYAYLYAFKVRHRRWPEAESVIMSDPQSAFLYARDVLHGRWKEAEPYIEKDPQWAERYKKEILHAYSMRPGSFW